MWQSNGWTEFPRTRAIDWLVRFLGEVRPRWQRESGRVSAPSAGLVVLAWRRTPEYGTHQSHPADPSHCGLRRRSQWQSHTAGSALSPWHGTCSLTNKQPIGSGLWCPPRPGCLESRHTTRRLDHSLNRLALEIGSVACPTTPAAVNHDEMAVSSKESIREDPPWKSRDSSPLDALFQVIS